MISFVEFDVISLILKTKSPKQPCFMFYEINRNLIQFSVMISCLESARFIKSRRGQLVKKITSSLFKNNKIKKDLLNNKVLLFEIYWARK